MLARLALLCFHILNYDSNTTETLIKLFSKNKETISKEQNIFSNFKKKKKKNLAKFTKEQAKLMNQNQKNQNTPGKKRQIKEEDSETEMDFSQTTSKKCKQHQKVDDPKEIGHVEQPEGTRN